MSKRKTFSGSTMTLKDFHGGSIPSDLPLPSAPGVTARPLDRGGFDRPLGGGWGSGGIAGAGRSDNHRPRPGSAGGGTPRVLEDATPFLPHIGRNFDEDERKPFDESSTPRRAVAPPDGRPSSSVDVRPLANHQVVQGRPGSSPAMQFSSPVHQSFGGSVATVAGGGARAPSPQSHGADSGRSLAPSPWAMKKDVVMETPSRPALSGATAASRFAQASAVEKVSSGRWQSRHTSFNQQPDVEIITFPVNAGGDVKVRDSSQVVLDAVSERMHSVRSVFDRDYDRGRTPVHLKAKEGIVDSSGSAHARPLSAEGRFTGQQLCQQEITEVSERLKLNVLPRTKPIELPDAQHLDKKQVCQPPITGSGNAEKANDSRENLSSPVLGLDGSDGGNPSTERPRLNLLPRSQRIEKPLESSDKERERVFGGARPREIVLKERGINDAVLTNVDQALVANRVRHEAYKIDVTLEEHPALTIRHGEKPEAFTVEHRTGRDVRKDQRVEPEKTEMQRGSWRSDNTPNPKEMDKPLECSPGPESWRKPEEQPYPNNQGPRLGKAASPLELAQAFSRSASDTRSRISATSQRNLPAHNPVPFSRLTEKRDVFWCK